ncbi:MAG: UvrD-helicase domain-containing protein [Rhodospirillaceae bacterium]|jgi:DNA helicase IV|nr:UvrD-helicase domain-containing protein [Rhodospirillaceae bacterium]
MLSSSEHEINRRGLAAGFIGLFGNRFRGIRLTDTAVVLLAQTQKEVSFLEMERPVQVSGIFWFGAISLSLFDGSRLKITGLKRAEAVAFVNAANMAWRQSVTAIFDAIDEEIIALAEVVERLNRPRRFPSACLLEPFLERANALVARIPKIDLEDFISAERLQMLNAVLSFQKSPNQARDRAIKTFIDAELIERKGFFDTIESNPLTPEQRLSVLTDEDATLILAGAGSGKTSVIVAKAAYLIQRAVRQPKEILLMAFGNAAAEEMAARIEKRCGSFVDARTFHALGYEIIRKVEGQAPALAPHASDDAQFRALLREILIDNVASQKVLGALLLKWFSEFYWPYKSEWDFQTKHEYNQYVRAHELRTLQGELVKSFEELQIANWLYSSGISYEYEPIYEHDLPKNDRRAYMPDFRLKEGGVYIEHFGLRKEQIPDGTFRLTTRHDIDRDKYLEERAWKRKVHREHGTKLIETYSFERDEGRLTESLQEKLAPHASPNPAAHEQIFDRLTEMGQVDAFTQTLSTFLKHFKSAGLSVDQCRQRAEKSEDKSRGLAFLKIFEPLIEAYQRRLGERIDFEDMIVRATGYVKSGRYQSRYGHLLVDEFQDISEGRAQLLLALQAQRSDARIFAVGDDWQSVYRFSGSDIHLMRHFGSIFGGSFAGSRGVHRTVDLGRTFRSVDKIALPARSFVLKNPSQIEKRVVSADTTDAPSIKVAYYSYGEEDASLRIALDEVKKTSTGDDKISVFLLGRYHFVRPKNLDLLGSSYPDLAIRFMTIHASKGLEADHVIVLRAASDRLGFPSEIIDDPLLNIVLPEPEDFDHAEERRLFYVALTRARKSVTVLGDRESPSVFVDELIEDDEYGVVELGESGIAEHRCGACGGRMLAHKAKNGRPYFACEHKFLCGETLSPCNVCNMDLPVKANPTSEVLVCSCGAQFPACLECDDGWLVERNGRYGNFLGCVNYPSCKGSRQLTTRRE